jgi:hypothetical protein
MELRPPRHLSLSTSNRPPVSLAPVQGSLALEWDGATLPTPPTLRLLTPEPSAHPLTPTAGRLLQALLDVDAGLRPAHQVLTWTSPAVYRALLRRQERRRAITNASGNTRTPQVRVMSVRVSEISESAAEISAVVLRVDSRGQRRAGAAAARMESRDGHWQAMAFEC